MAREEMDFHALGLEHPNKAVVLRTGPDEVGLSQIIQGTPCLIEQGLADKGVPRVAQQDFAYRRNLVQTWIHIVFPGKRIPKPHYSKPEMTAPARRHRPNPPVPAFVKV